VLSICGIRKRDGSWQKISNNKKIKMELRAIQETFIKVNDTLSELKKIFSSENIKHELENDNYREQILKKFDVAVQCAMQIEEFVLKNSDNNLNLNIKTSQLLLKLLKAYHIVEYSKELLKYKYNILQYVNNCFTCNNEIRSELLTISQIS
jgi:hypothetical protein